MYLLWIACTIAFAVVMDQVAPKPAFEHQAIRGVLLLSWFVGSQLIPLAIRIKLLPTDCKYFPPGGRPALNKERIKQFLIGSACLLSAPVVAGLGAGMDYLLFGQYWVIFTWFTAIPASLLIFGIVAAGRSWIDSDHEMICGTPGR